jgi:hypothetical protein
MSDSSLNQRALALTLATPATITNLPAAPEAAPQAAPTSQAALRKCRAAWQRAFDAYMRGEGSHDSTDHFLAAREAAKAFAPAMPALSGPDGIRDFIACAAYGILIGAIPVDRAGQVLYAAQIALAALPRGPKSA